MLINQPWLLGYLWANPATSAQSVACAGIYSAAGKKGDRGFCTGMRSVHKSSHTAVTQWKVSFIKRTVKNLFLPDDCLSW